MAHPSRFMFDAKKLQDQLSKLSERELSALEDDLDFCNFTGVPSNRVLGILKEMVDLDPRWKERLDRQAEPVLPAAY